MRYYLSYIERHGHAALMLSEQSENFGPTKIICELGFAPAPDLETVRFWRTYSGRVATEANASRAMYSTRPDVKHRTYEISSLEAERFFNKIKRDGFQEHNGSWLQVNFDGGPDYQKLTHNCKVYAMSVLKEVGIIDAEELSDFLIQRPQTHNSLLKLLSKRELACPLKDELLEKATSVLLRFIEELESIDIGLEKPDDDAKKLAESIQNLLAMAKFLFKTKEKIGVKQDWSERFKKMSPLIEKIVAVTKSEALNHFKQDLDDIVVKTDKVIQLSEEGGLEFFWKGTPPLAPRLNLDNFNLEEKARFLIDIKSNEISNGFAQILLDINIQIAKLKHFDRDFYLDLKDLKALIESTQICFNESNHAFLEDLNAQDSSAVIAKCMAQQALLDEMVANLEESVHQFKARTAETSLFIRFIHRIIAFFKQDFIKIEHVHSLMEGSIQSLENSNRRFDSQIKMLDKAIVDQTLMQLPIHFEDLDEYFFMQDSKDIAKYINDHIQEASEIEGEAIPSGKDHFQAVLAELDKLKDHLGGAPFFGNQVPFIDDQDTKRTFFGIPMAAVKDWLRQVLIKEWIPQIFWVNLARYLNVTKDAMSQYEEAHIRIQRFGLLIANKDRFFDILQNKDQSHYAELLEVTGMVWHPGINSTGVEKTYIEFIEIFLTDYFEDAKSKGEEALIEYFKAFEGVCLEDRARFLEEYAQAHPLPNSDFNEVNEIADWTTDSFVEDVYLKETVILALKHGGLPPRPDELWDHLNQKGIFDLQFRTHEGSKSKPSKEGFKTWTKEQIDLCILSDEGPNLNM